MDTIVKEINDIDKKFDKSLENLKREMNFSSLIQTIKEKADSKDVSKIKFELNA